MGGKLMEKMSEGYKIDKEKLDKTVPRGLKNPDFCPRGVRKISIFVRGRKIPNFVRKGYRNFLPLHLFEWNNPYGFL